MTLLRLEFLLLFCCIMDKKRGSAGGIKNPPRLCIRFLASNQSTFCEPQPRGQPSVTKKLGLIEYDGVRDVVIIDRSLVSITANNELIQNVQSLLINPARIPSIISNKKTCKNFSIGTPRTSNLSNKCFNES